MNELGNNKQLLLNQVKNQTSIDVNTLKKLVDTYRDLEPDDFKGIIDDGFLEQLKDLCRDPREVAAFNAFGSVLTVSSLTTLSEVEEQMQRVRTFLNTYSQSSKVNEARLVLQELEKRKKELIEERDWQELCTNSAVQYATLRDYKTKYPESVHIKELDEMMWKVTISPCSKGNLERYIIDWDYAIVEKQGRHLAEAKRALQEYEEWDKIRHQYYDSSVDKLIAVRAFMDKYSTCAFIQDVNTLFYDLRDAELRTMKDNPSQYSVNDVKRLIDAEVFRKYDFIDEGLATEESWERTFSFDIDALPNLQDYQKEDPTIQTPTGSTDIFFFGTPGTGKTCLLMGLAGADGHGYTLNAKVGGGPYISALQQWVHEGATPGRTFGKFVTYIHGSIKEKAKGDKYIDHPINLIEMSGEEFAHRIADNEEVSLSNMGTGATNLLLNNNRKVFFIIVDSTKPRIKFEYLEDERDPVTGEFLGSRLRKTYISQLDCLNKFTSLFELPENQKIMEKVDAIHFIVTKADTLGDRSERLTKAKDLLNSQYTAPVQRLINYCQNTKRVNYSTDYRPHVYTFSLGHFYLGDIFDREEQDTLEIVELIRSVTVGVKPVTWWDKFIATLQ